MPGAKILYLSGNHEERLPRYLMRTAPELAELSELTIPALLGLSGLGIEWYDERTHLVLGGLHVIHGHEYRVGRGVVNPAKITPDRTRRPVLTGHYHTASEYTHRDIEEHVSAAWTVPCLCDLHPPYYRLPHQWGHGYAIVERTDHGFRCRVKRIINGEIF